MIPLLPPPKLDQLKKLVNTFPELPGVYLMKSEVGEVLYVGKAKSLAARVKNYLGGNDGRRQIPFLMMKVHSIDKMVCENEGQALLLERDLIQNYKPYYNIRLKDDKAYLRVRINRTKPWPRIELVRRVENDGADYYGPYVSGYKLRNVLDVIRQVVPLRTCSDSVLNNRSRPCIEYQIKRCAAPCVLAVDLKEYNQWLDQAVSILEGEGEAITRELTSEMNVASSELRFEVAAILRDRLKVLEDFTSGHSSAIHQGDSRDVFGYESGPLGVTVSILQVRSGRITGGENFLFHDVQLEICEFLESFIEEYYRQADYLPPSEVLIPEQLLNDSLLGVALNELRGEPVDFITPEGKSGVRLLELARLNAKQHHLTVFNEEVVYTRLAERMKKLFLLDQFPRKIECIDISTLMGTSEVGALTSFFDGTPVKSQYRRYRINKTTDGPNDFAAIYQVVQRRLRAGINSGDFPDLLIIDGGKGQLSMALKACSELGIEIGVVSLAKIKPKSKDRGIKNPERIFLPGRSKAIPLKSDDPLTHLLQRIRDETHRFVIDYHRNLRSKKDLSSVLDNIIGIGTARKVRLLKHFGSLDRIALADVEQIAKVGRMVLPLAVKVKNALTID
jgi:excinuclease ABC subunit C